MFKKKTYCVFLVPAAVSKSLYQLMMDENLAYQSLYMVSIFRCLLDSELAKIITLAQYFFRYILLDI